MTRLVDDALQLITEHPVSPQSRHFIATSLESAVKSDLDLQDARSASAPPWLYGGYPYYPMRPPLGWR